MEKAVHTAQRHAWSIWGLGFNHQLSYASVLILIFSIAGCELTSIRVPNLAGFVIAYILVVAGIVPPLLHLLRRKGRAYLFDSALTIMWSIFLFIFLHFSVVVAARLGARVPLYDSSLAILDQKMGVRVPGIVQWTSHHWIGHLADRSYSLLGWMLAISILVPIFGGKVSSAKRFLIANVWAFAIGIPLFALFPAVGPWYGYHLTPDRGQAACEAAFFAMRASGPYVFRGNAGVICFPSFHVIWAILCAQALWAFRYLRIPAAILAALIIASTLTTGWHYFCDVLAGMLIAGISILIAMRVVSLQASVQDDPREVQSELVVP